MPCFPQGLILIPMNFAWDGTTSETEIIIRRMLYDDPRKVIRDYGKERLREIFLKYIHRFDRRNRSFWPVALRIEDEEIARASASNFREACKIWDY